MADHYQIRVRGQLDQRWSDWFDGLTVTPTACGDTVLRGPVRDQAQLYGILARVRDLALPLVSVHRIAPPGSAEAGARGVGLTA